MILDYDKRDKNNNNLFLSFEQEDITFKEAYKKIEKITFLFQEFGIKQGDKIAIMSSNDLEISLLFIASLLNGITASIIDNDTKKVKLNNILTLLEPKVIFIDEENIKGIDIDFKTNICEITQKNIQPIIKKFIKSILKSKIDNYYELLNRDKYTKPKCRVNLKQTAYILFTSGTTSSPKGVEISYNNLFTHIKTLQNVYKINKNSKILNILVLSHADGIIQGPVLAFFSQIPLYRPMKFEINKIDKLLKAINTKDITHFITVPTMLSLIEQFGQDFSGDLQNSKLYCIVSAGALLEATLWSKFQDTFKQKIINVYGLTESVIGGFFTELGNNKHIGTIGSPIDCNAKIIDNNGFEVDDGEKGELLLSGAHIMKGYYKNSEATQNSIKNSWLYTGDLAVRENNIYKIVGRKKSIILTGGFTVYPEEIIEILNSNKNIKESTVFGLEHKTWGEEVVACVVKHKNSDISKIDILEFCRESLEAHKVPKKIEFVEELSKGRSGKIIISEVKMKYFNKNVKNRDNELYQKIFQIASDNFLVPIETIDENSSPDTISSWDSLGHLEFIALIEERLKISFNTSEMLQIENISDIIRIVKSKIENAS